MRNPPFRCVKDSCLQLVLYLLFPFYFICFPTVQHSLWSKKYDSIQQGIRFTSGEKCFVFFFSCLWLCYLLLINAAISISGKSNSNEMERKRKILASDICLILVTSGISALHEFVPEYWHFWYSYLSHFGPWVNQLFSFVLYFLYKLK